MAPDLGIIREPKCLIETGPDGKLAVNDSVVEELKSIEGHVVVVSIAGPYRTGKSFLMNKLHGQNKGKKTSIVETTEAPVIRHIGLYSMVQQHST